MLKMVHSALVVLKNVGWPLAVAAAIAGLLCLVAGILVQPLAVGRNTDLEEPLLSEEALEQHENQENAAQGQPHKESNRLADVANDAAPMHATSEIQPV
jgi:hypothetical protein